MTDAQIDSESCSPHIATRHGQATNSFKKKDNKWVIGTLASRETKPGHPGLPLDHISFDYLNLEVPCPQNQTGHTSNGRMCVCVSTASAGTGITRRSVNSSVKSRACLCVDLLSCTGFLRRHFCTHLSRECGGVRRTAGVMLFFVDVRRALS